MRNGAEPSAPTGTCTKPMETPSWLHRPTTSDAITRGDTCSRQPTRGICGACRSEPRGRLGYPSDPSQHPDSAETTVVSMANCLPPQKGRPFATWSNWFSHTRAPASRQVGATEISAGMPTHEQADLVAKHVQPCSMFADRSSVEGPLLSDEVAKHVQPCSMFADRSSVEGQIIGRGTLRL